MHWSNKILLGLLGGISIGFADFSVGDTLAMNAGYSNSIGMSGGSTDAVEVLDSIRRSGDTTVYGFAVVSTTSRGFFEIRSEIMVPLVREARTKLVVLHSLPRNVRTTSKLLRQSKWILPDSSTTIFFKSILPFAKFAPIPLLDTTSNDPLSLGYTARISDTLGMRWSNAKGGKGDFAGQRIRFKNAADTVGTPIPDSASKFVCSDVPVWTSNPSSSGFAFSALRLSSQVHPLNATKMDMGAGCYRMSVFGYKKFQGSSSIRSGKTTGSTARPLGRFGRVAPDGRSLRRESHAPRLQVSVDSLSSSSILSFP